MEAGKVDEAAVTALCGYPRAAPGSHESVSHVFMRLVLGKFYGLVI
jgi:hypothetical protein